MTEQFFADVQSSGREGSLGERYFVAKTSSGVCVVNYQPGEERYIGGPFITWDGAYAFVGRHRRKRVGMALVIGCASLAILAVTAALLRAVFV